MLKKLLCITTIAAMAVTMGACGQSSDPSNQKNAPAKSMEEIFSEKPNGKKLIVASNGISSGRGDAILEKAREEGFNIEFVDLGGGDITARVISEVNNPTINVVWGPSEDQFTAMIEAGALSEFTPQWSDKISVAPVNEGYAWSYEIQPKVLLANPDVYTEETAPTCYQDLWEKEEFHGKYAVPNSANFGGNTPRAIIGGILAQYLDPEGELGVSDEGWAAIKAYFDNGYKTPKGEDDFGNMASGKVPITFAYASAVEPKSKSFGVTPLILYSTTGEPTNTNQLGVVKNKDSEVLEESLRFANWLGQADTIGIYAEKNGSIVANIDAVDKMLPVAKEIQSNYKPQEVDWEYVNSMMDDWIAKIQLEIY